MSGRLRVTGGRLGGRRLRVPAGGMRPTSDRVRESLFARLGDLTGDAVLDLYAGSGALAIEAVSRGARSAVCVESAPRSLAALRANLASLGLEGEVRVVAGDAPRGLRRLGRSGERFELVLLDPPYASDEAQRALRAVVECRVLSERGVVVLERDRRHPSPRVDGLELLDERRYGDTVISRFVATAQPAADSRWQPVDGAGRTPQQGRPRTGR